MNILACILLIGALAASSLVQGVDLNRVFLLAFFLVMSISHHLTKKRPWWFRLPEFLLIACAFVIWIYSLTTPNYVNLFPVLIALLVVYAIALVGWNWQQPADDSLAAQTQVRRVLPWVITSFIALAWLGHTYGPKPARVISEPAEPKVPAAIPAPVIVPRDEDDVLMDELERAKQ